MQADLLQRVRKHIFEYFLEHAAPPVVEQLMTAFGLSRDEAVNALRELENGHHIALVPGTARILMAFPFSAVATPFRVHIRGRDYFANCAWDAIAFHAMLGDELQVASYCHHCATPIAVEMRDGHARQVEPAGAIVYLGLRPTEWWENIVDTCGNTMVFFASPEHRDALALIGAADVGASLTPDQVHALSGLSYARKLDLDYRRPTREEWLAHFAAIGLTGDYWQL